MADTKTYLKVPYSDTVLRALPLNSGHLMGLTLAQQMSDGNRQTKAITRVLSRVLDEDAYERITNDYIDGDLDLAGLVKFLQAVATATAAFHKAQGDPDAVSGE